MLPNLFPHIIMIVYKKTDECTSSENEWQRVVQQVTANGNEWYSE